MESGAILLAGVGPNITNTQTIEQISNDEGSFFVTANTSADMSLAGSATTLALDANYDGFNVNVTNLTNADTVTYGGTGPTDTSTGSDLGTLTLSHATPIGLLSTISLTLDSTSSPTDLTIDQLVVAPTSPALAALNVDSTGDAGTNVISDVHLVAANVVISGGTALEFGDSFADGYSLLGGTIDATASTGNVTTFLSLTTGAGSTIAAQTFIAGHGTDFVNVANSGGDQIDFSVGGTDTVQFFSALATGNHPLADLGPPTALNNYNNVLGFTAAHDSININTGAANIPTSFTDTGGLVTNTPIPPATTTPVTALNFTTGTTINGTLSHDNFIDFVNPVNTSAGETAQMGFAAAVGGGLSSIQVFAPGGHNYLFSYYDATDGEAVIGTAASVNVLGSQFITANSTIHVIGLIHESAADYAGIAGNVHFA